MATPEDLLGHFEACGTVERVTIVCDKMSGRPKGKRQVSVCVSEVAEAPMIRFLFIPLHIVSYTIRLCIH